MFVLNSISLSVCLSGLFFQNHISFSLPIVYMDVPVLVCKWCALIFLNQFPNSRLKQSFLFEFTVLSIFYHILWASPLALSGSSSLLQSFWINSLQKRLFLSYEVRVQDQHNILIWKILSIGKCVFIWCPVI